MRVAVGEFGEFGGADGDDLDVKMEGLAGELVIAIERHFFAFDLLDREDAHTEISFGVKAHAELRGIGAKGVERDALEKLVAVFAVAELRRHRDGFGGADFEAFDALLEAGDDVLRAVEVLHRAAIAGGVDDVSLVVLQGVFDADDSFFSYAHSHWDVRNYGVPGRWQDTMPSKP